MRARELVRETARALRGGEREKLFDARIIVETACGLDAGGLLRDPEVGGEDEAAARELAERRALGEPIQYIVGHWPFCGYEFSVGSGVLIPRPETEKLALMASGFLNDRGGCVYIDLCSGSGCVPIAAVLKSGAEGAAAVELSPEAYAYLKKNIDELCPRVTPVLGDVFGFERGLPDASVDLITCNPPYVSESEYLGNYDELRFEPRRALVPEGAVDGFYDYISREYFVKLRRGGTLMLECASARTDETAEIMTRYGYVNVEVVRDDYGLKRFVTGVKP